MGIYLALLENISPSTVPEGMPLNSVPQPEMWIVSFLKRVKPSQTRERCEMTGALGGMIPPATYSLIQHPKPVDS